jgi:hypothetical protein
MVDNYYHYILAYGSPACYYRGSLINRRASMSNQTNTQLYERASDMMDQWTGTQRAERIEFIMGLNDLDELEKAVREAESASYQALKDEAYQEAQDEMTEERAATMYKEFGDAF